MTKPENHFPHVPNLQAWKQANIYRETDMAKCPVCNSRKGKRQCVIANGLVCSQCCGTIRKENLCLDCSYYQKPKRKYNEVPSFTRDQMEANTQCQDYSNAIELALCNYDIESNRRLKDAEFIKIIEMLIDKYHFKDAHIKCNSPLLLGGFHSVDAVIREDLANVDELLIVKILKVFRFVVKIRPKIGREFMDSLHYRYTRQKAAEDAHILSQP